MGVKKEVVYPVFLECCQYTTDSFWESVFEELAYGKTPHGTYIVRESLMCSYKKKSFCYKIEKGVDPEQLYEDMYDLLVNRLGLLSQREKAKKRTEFDEAEEKLRESHKDWASIKKKKNVRELLIEQYVIRSKKRYHLPISQAKYLLSVISLGMIFKVISCKDIDYHDNQIQNISGISFEEGRVILDRDIYDLNATFSPQIVIDRHDMSEQWVKYLKDIRKLFK